MQGIEQMDRYGAQIGKSWNSTQLVDRCGDRAGAIDGVAALLRRDWRPSDSKVPRIGKIPFAHALRSISEGR